MAKAQATAASAGAVTSGSAALMDPAATSPAGVPDLQQPPADHAGTEASDNGAMSTEPAETSHESIQRLAYQLWMNRGCPTGSPEVDWEEAERICRSMNETQTSSQASMPQ